MGDGARIFVGQASWSIPKGDAAAFPAEGTHLQRYAQGLTGVEINSSFYRPHRPSTYAKWAESVPAGFRFALKAPQAITHERRLVGCEFELEAFLMQSAELGEKRGPILFQLPPKLAFDAAIAADFLGMLRAHHGGPVAFEPRHRSWFEAEAEGLLREFGIARVAADPAVVPRAAAPGGDTRLVYYRWHGSPKMYYSAYSPEAIQALAGAIAARPAVGETWCIFDNTAAFAAMGNALSLLRLVAGRAPSSGLAATFSPAGEKGDTEGAVGEAV